MFTHTGTSLLQKTAGWGAAPKHLISAGKVVSKAFPKVFKAVTTAGSAGVKTMDLAVRGLTTAGNAAIKNPKTVIPLALAGTVGAWKFSENQPAYEAHIDSPNSDVTTISPFKGSIKFTDPSYAKYYS